jgi:hypothetical protein
VLFKIIAKTSNRQDLNNITVQKGDIQISGTDVSHDNILISRLGLKFS